MVSETALRMNMIWNTPRLAESSRTAIIWSRKEAIIASVQPVARISVSPGSRAIIPRPRRVPAP